MKHSVVIPLFNKEKYVAKTIDSLANQSKKPDELIIVDDLSTDQSLSILEKSLAENASAFANTSVQIIRLNENKGPGNARNVGLELSTSELISFLDADDCYHPECLKLVGEIVERENIDLLILGIRYVPSNDYYPQIASFKHELIQLSDELFLMPQPLLTVTSPDFVMGSGCNVVVRRKWLDELRFSENVNLNECIDLWYRVVKSLTAHKYPKVALLNGKYIDVQEVEGSLSRKNYQHWKELSVPILIERYLKSDEISDQLLFSMIGIRWCEHAIERLTSHRQKFLFLFHNRSVLRVCFWIRYTKSRKKYFSV